MLSIGTCLEKRVRFWDTRRILNPHGFRLDFAGVSERAERKPAPLPRDPEALRHDIALTYGLELATGRIDRWDCEDFRFRDPAQLRRLMDTVLLANAPEAAILRLEMQMCRIVGDPSGKWLPYQGRGVADAGGADGAVTGWYCASRENIDGGRFEFRAIGEDGEPYGSWIQKELSAGYIAVATGPVEWRMSPVFSWDTHFPGALDMVHWTLKPSRAGSSPDLLSLAPSLREARKAV